MARETGATLLFSEPPFSKRTLCFKHKMADLNYDFSMNQLKNRLETFKDWPFTEETGSSCTAQKVIGCFDCSKNYFAANRLSLRWLCSESTVVDVSAH